MDSTKRKEYIHLFINTLRFITYFIHKINFFLFAILMKSATFAVEMIAEWSSW